MGGRSPISSSARSPIPRRSNVRPEHGLRHPLIFYWAHAAVFYVNKLRLAGIIDRHIDEGLERLFESGVDEMPGDVVDRPRSYWPDLVAVHALRRAVYRRVREIIATHPTLEDRSLDATSPAWALLMAMEHERIHLDTSSALIRELPIRLVRAPAQWPEIFPDAGEPKRNRWLPCHGGPVHLGRPEPPTSFGWDNEFGRRNVVIPPFSVSETLVSNRELADFVTAGGYQHRRFWSEQGWQWRARNEVERPAFWLAGDNGEAYRLRTLFATMPMPWNWPAEVNHHEATAFCAWRTERDQSPVAYRMLTEAEHRWLSRDPPGEAGDETDAPDGNALRELRSINANLAWGSPRPVDSGRPTPAGVYELRGNVWEWCEDDFNPLGGFATHPLYADFSTPCFDGAHKMILGGSFIATGAEASPWARFHFRPHFFRHAGFRLALSTTDEPAPAIRLSSKYDDRATRDQYLLLHYGDAQDRLPSVPRELARVPFPVITANLAARFATRHHRALDLGCATGRASFELARYFHEVFGIDASWSLIAAATALRHDQPLPYELVTDVGRSETRVAARPSDVAVARVGFVCEDALDLPASLGTFDAVIAANLFDRVRRPTDALRRAAERVAAAGVLVVTCPYTWNEAFTPRSEWRLDYEVLGNAFARIHEEDVCLVLREHGRKYELVVAHVTVWRRLG